MFPPPEKKESEEERERETGERGYRGERGKNEHECWEKTVTEGMAMQADHKQYSYRKITKTSSHSSTFKSNYFHSAAMLGFFGYAGSQPQLSGNHSSLATIQAWV